MSSVPKRIWRWEVGGRRLHVRQPDRADAGGSQIQAIGSPARRAPDAQRPLAFSSFFLTLGADLGKDQVAIVGSPAHGSFSDLLSAATAGGGEFNVCGHLARTLFSA